MAQFLVDSFLSTLALTLVCFCFYFAYLLVYRFRLDYHGWTTADEALGTQIPDFSRKFILITGANSGIGFETVKSLLKTGATVIMACRNLQKAKTARDDILSQLSKNIFSFGADKRLFVIQTDLGSLQSVSTVSSQLKKLESDFKKSGVLRDSSTSLFIDYIILNAGIMALPEYKESVDGYEMQFATNHLGHFYLTQLVLDFNLSSAKNQVQMSSATKGLEKGARDGNNEQKSEFKRGCRVISVASLAHMGVPVTDFGKRFVSKYKKLGVGPRKETYRPWTNYSISKACNILFARGLVCKLKNADNKLKDAGIAVESVSLHPGTILTNLARELNPAIVRLGRAIEGFLKLVYFKSAQQGAATTVRCVVLEKNQLVSGGYYDSCQPSFVRYGITRNDYKNALDLWDWSVDLIEKKGFQVPRFD